MLNDLLRAPIPRGRISQTLREDLTNLIRSTACSLDQSESVRTFEKEFAAYLGRKFCLAFPFARTGIYEILKSMNLPEGSVVVMPPLTIKPILDVVYSLGLVPKFVDLDRNSVCFDLEKLRTAMDSRPKVAILTYLFGIVPDVEQIVGILRRNQVFIIEDFSQCLGGAFAGRAIGTFGDVGVYSASSTKTIDTYGGGLVVLDDSEIHARLRSAQTALLPPNRQVLRRKILTSLVRNAASSTPIFSILTFPVLWVAQLIDSTFLNRFTGSRDVEPLANLPREWFYQYTSFQAKFGSKQLRSLGEKNARRVQRVRQIVDSSPSYVGPRGHLSGLSNYWQLIFYARDFRVMKKSLMKFRIDCATTSLSLISELTSYPHASATPNAREIFCNGVYLPCFHQLSRSQVERIVFALSSMEN